VGDSVRSPAGEEGAAAADQEDAVAVSRRAFVDRLVGSGMSRLSAERAAEIRAGLAAPGRARKHRAAGW
jgi:hypothetical protein